MVAGTTVKIDMEEIGTTTAGMIEATGTATEVEDATMMMEAGAATTMIDVTGAPGATTTGPEAEVAVDETIGTVEGVDVGTPRLRGGRPLPKAFLHFRSVSERLPGGMSMRPGMNSIQLCRLNRLVFSTSQVQIERKSHLF